MLIRLSLRSQIYLILGSLVIVLIAGGVTIIRHSKWMEGMMLEIVDKELVKYQITESMEKALVNQKGFVTYFYLDQDPGWLEQLGIYRQIFKERLNEILLVEQDEDQRRLIETLNTNYSEYIAMINQVIYHYKKGETQQGFQLHLSVRKNFFDIMKACELYKMRQTENIRKNWNISRSEGRRLMVSLAVIAVVVFVMTLVLIVLLVSRILDPLHQLAAETRRHEDGTAGHNEIQQLSEDVHELIEDAGHAHEALEQSRVILMQSEKLALVGKLAAGMAHSIRNPLTSVKMRLFSLGRTLDLSDSQKEDFDVISEEIRHLDIIVQNFLEFSRPPRLTMQLISPSMVVDQSLQLLEHRLKSYNVQATVKRDWKLTAVQCDPEQLKEVFVNLIVNACEAMKTGGEIWIEELEESVSNRHFDVIRVIDSGPGIPDSIVDHIFEPFFSTKDEGTGLGLSIAARIVSEHGGKLDVSVQQEAGTTFTLTFPINGA